MAHDLGKRQTRHIIGLMSGSSCDGVDAALVRVEGTGRGLKAELLAFETVPYDDAFRARLLDPDLNVRDVLLLNVEVGQRLAEGARRMQRAAEGLGLRVDLVGSHGHTLAHVPPGSGSPVAGTLQVGEPAVIAERTGLPVVSDFRARDMAAGGQGAPLVPYVDWLLFARDEGATACLNIGGIANFTVVTPRIEDLYAFDTGPGNMPIDGAVRARTGGQRHYDTDGRMAEEGRIDEALLERLLAHPYFEKAPPKSTGREDFAAELYLGKTLEDEGLKTEDLVATVTAAVGKSIARAYGRFVGGRYPGAPVIVSGGGARNPTLLGWLRGELPGVEVRRSDECGLSADAKEAVAFAILANETICGTPANVPSATGARHAAILGKVTPA